MTTYNRIKCAASTDGSGMIVLGAARPGYQVMPDTWSPGAEVPGDYPYLLEDAFGNWEIGYIRVNAAGAYLGRFTTDGSTFADGTAGLVFSQGPSSLTTVACSPSGGNPPKATNSSLAIGENAVSSVGVTGAVAVGNTARAQKNGSIAIGNGSLADGVTSVAIGQNAAAHYEGEIAVGTANTRGNFRLMPIKNSVIVADGTVDFFTPSFGIMDFRTWPNGGYAANGVLHISGTLTIDDSVNPGVLAYTKVIEFDYTIWIDVGLGTVTVLGTPTYTAMYTGVSAVASTLGLNATTGILTLTSAYVGGSVTARGIMRIDNLASGG